MIGTTNSPTHGSGPAVIQGQLSVITETMKFLDTFMDDLVNVLDDVIDDASKRLELEAAGDQEWQEYAENLDVELIDGEIHVYHNGSDLDDQEMASLEYGDFATAPSPLLRTFAFTEVPKMQKEIQERLNGMVPYA